MVATASWEGVRVAAAAVAKAERLLAWSQQQQQLKSAASCGKSLGSGAEHVTLPLLLLLYYFYYYHELKSLLLSSLAPFFSWLYEG